MNERWLRTEEHVNALAKLLEGNGIKSGNVLDLCCGNGRFSVFMALKGFKVTGVDISNTYLEDAKKKAAEYKVSDLTRFLQSDVRNLTSIPGVDAHPFDVVINAWTSIGFYSPEDDLKVFKQARELSREGAIFFILETMHSEYASLKFTPTAYTELDNFVLLENRKYDALASEMLTTWAFYSKRGEDLVFIDKVELRLHVYSLCELSALLKKAKWEVLAYYGNIVTLQPMSALTSMNIVAKAV